MKLLFYLALCSIFNCSGIPKRHISSSSNNLELLSVSMNPTEIGMVTGRDFIVSDTIDLKGQILNVPEDVTIVIDKGIIRNGTLIGRNTKIKYKKKVFEKIHIDGTWIVPYIKTSMFSDLNYKNSLRDVFALTNPLIKNTVVVEKGDYYISLSHDADKGILVNNNTNVKLEGNIYLEPNEYPNYSIIKINGNNVVIEGHGKIFGDRYEHLAKNGEWGMGVMVSGKSQNIVIKGISVYNCWGDCLYITSDSKNILINSCHLEGGRRQGISVISADNLTISNCVITNIGGTDPGYAIDVEPDANDTVGTIVIDRVKCYDCAGGFTASGRSKGSVVDSIVVKNSTFKAKGKPAVISSTCRSITIRNCHVTQEVGNKTIAFEHIDNLTVFGNSFFYQNSIRSKFEKKIKGLLKVDTWPIIIRECDSYLINKNKGL